MYMKPLFARRLRPHFAWALLLLLCIGAGCAPLPGTIAATPTAVLPPEATPEALDPSAYRALRDFPFDLDRDGEEDVCTLYLPAGCDGILTDSYAVGAVSGATGADMGMQAVSHPARMIYVDSMVCEPYSAGDAAYLLVGGEMTGTVLHFAYTVLQYRATSWQDIFGEHGLEGLVYTLQMQDGPRLQLRLETGDSYTLSPSREAYLQNEWIFEDGTLTPAGSAAFGEHTTFMNLYAGVEEDSFVLRGVQELRGPHKLDVQAHLRSTWRYDGTRWHTAAHVAPVNDTIAAKHYDLDGDGIADTVVSASITMDMVTTLEIQPAGADACRFTFDGVDSTRTAAADVDGDGVQEILYFAALWGSNFGGGQAHVYRVRDGFVTELPGVHRYTLEEGCQEFLEMHTPGLCIGLEAALLPDGREGARVSQFGTWATTIVFDAVYDNEAAVWRVQQTHVRQSPDSRRAQADADALRARVRAHRPGFRVPEVDYSVCDFDVDIPILDPESGVVLLTFRERAQIALRGLYDMLGYLPERCGAWGTQHDYSSIFFGHTAHNARYNRNFYCATIDAVTGDALYIDMLYNGSYDGRDIDYGIPTDVLVKPPGMRRMSPQEIALWYYEHSSYGTREPILRVEQSPFAFGDTSCMFNLVLEDNRFYEVGFSAASPFPISFYGPYPEGFTH